MPFTNPKYGIDDLFMGFSVVAVVFAVVGASGTDLYLASTQWMLIAGVLALWGIYLRLLKK